MDIFVNIIQITCYVRINGFSVNCSHIEFSLKKTACCISINSQLSTLFIDQSHCEIDIGVA